MPPVLLKAFPQQDGNWCGIAAIFAVSVYDYTVSQQTPPSNYSQQAIHDYLNSINSPWGPATYHDGGPGPYVSTDIAADVGEDPAAMSQGTYDWTPYPYYFHNWIYRTSNTTATYAFGSDFGPAAGINDPIIVAINGGAHFFVVSGVWANQDPSAGKSGTVIYDIQTHDPWLNSRDQGFDGTKPYNQTQTEAWSLSDWLSKSILWHSGYNTNNTYDPEPSTTGSNYYNPPFPGGYNAHWNGYYVTIEQE
jgi:hypothetical protein